MTLVIVTVSHADSARLRMLEIGRRGEGTSHVGPEPIVVNVHSPGTNECNYVFMLSLHS